jgi:multiple antibiotic resistance protein
MFNQILLAFIPIFVAVDAIGVLPIFISLTKNVKKQHKLKIIFQSMLTAGIVALGFIFLSKAIFKFLGVTIPDFMIAGGLILFCIAIMDILRYGKKKRIPEGELGIVPLGTPLIVGPAVLTTSLIIIPQYGLSFVLISVIANIFIAGIIFYLSDFILKIVGTIGTKVLSKITSLLLAAIAVMMIRKGLMILFY